MGFILRRGCCCGVTRISRRFKHLSSSSFSNAFSRRRSQYEPKSMGLFGQSDLVQPSGFNELFEKVSKSCQKLANEIARSKSDHKNSIDALDDLSNQLCIGADLTECMRLLHTDENWRAAAEQAMIAYTELVESLNTRRDLYKAVKSDLRTPSQLSDVEKRVGSLFLADFESSGVHLASGQREEFVSLNQAAFIHGAHFTRGCDAPVQVPKSLHNIIGTDDLHDSLAWHWDGRVRLAAYDIYHRFDQNQAHHLRKMIECRQNLAQLCDFDNFADRALQHCFLDTGSQAIDFVRELMNALKSSVARDVQRLSQQNHGLPPKIQDLPYLIAESKRSAIKNTLGIDPKNQSFADRHIRFELGGLINALADLCSRLYGVSIEPVSDGCAERFWANDVVKLATYDTNDNGGRNLLGHIYCDFTRRPNKFGGDCHFTVRCGKRLSDGTYQTPIVVLSLCLFDENCSELSGRERVLHGDQVENLVHEFGHALHSMLGRTKFQHVAGTRCSTDLAEVPSNLMECIFFDPEVLRDILRVRDGEKVCSLLF